MADLSKLRFNGTDYNVKDASAPLRKFTNYSKTGNLPITSDDTTQTAIGKLEKALDSKINTSAKGTASGVAELDANGKVPSSQLPSYVDDVLEYSAKSSFPATGETGKIYVDTTTNKTYRWSGSAYVEISESLALGETSSTAYRGDRGKAAYDHSQITNGNPHGTTGANTNLTGYSKGSSKDAVAATDTVNAAIAKHENRINANQSNILYNLNMGVKNLLASLLRVATIGSSNSTITFALRGDGSIVLNGSTTSSVAIFVITESGRWATSGVNGVDESFENISYKIALFDGGNASGSGVYLDIYHSGWADRATCGVGGNTTFVNPYILRLCVPENKTLNNVIVKPMVCTLDAWNQSTNYQPPALPNYDLTRLEAEDRASLAEVVDSGAKNLWANGTSGTISGWRETFQIGQTLKKGTYIISFDSLTSTDTDANTCQIIALNGTTQVSNYAQCPRGNKVYTILEISADANALWIYSSNSSGTGDGDTATFTNGMICTKAAFGVSQKFVPFGNDPFYQVPINHNMIYRGRNLGASLTDAQHTALSSGNFTDLYLGDYWTKTVTIPAGTYTGGDGQEVTVPAQTNITLKAVIADFDTFYAGYASSYAGINTHHAAVIVTGFSNVVWNKTNSTAGGYVASLIHKWLVGSVLPQIETWFGSAKVLSHQKLLTNAITGDAASGWAWSSQKISLLSENQMYGSKVWGNSKAANGGYEPGEAFKHLNVFNHIDANLLFGNENIWLRDIASAVWAASLNLRGGANYTDASNAGFAPAALILLS